MVVSIEQHVDWIADCIEYLARHGLDCDGGDVRGGGPVAPARQRGGPHDPLPAANSWYIGANIPGKPRVFMPYVGGVGAYRQKCDEVAARGYEGFRLTASAPRSRARTPAGSTGPA